MTAQQTTPPTRSSTVARLGAFVVAGAIAVAVAAVSIATWQGAGPGATVTHEGAAAGRQRDAPSSAAHVRRVTGGGSGAQPAAPPAAPRTQGTAHEAATATVYLVATPEAAAVVHALLMEREAVSAQTGRPARTDQVLVVGTAEDDARLGRLLAEDDHGRVYMGLPAVTVIDLRTP